MQWNISMYSLKYSKISWKIYSESLGTRISSESNTVIFIHKISEFQCRLTRDGYRIFSTL